MPIVYNILVMDDDPTILDLLTQTLQDEGYRVTTARNGQEGLARLRWRRFDLIVLDLMMPVMNGEQFVDALRRLRRLPPPIIVLSAHRNVQGKVRELGVAGGLPKPFSLDDLVREVAENVKRDA